MRNMMHHFRIGEKEPDITGLSDISLVGEYLEKLPHKQGVVYLLARAVEDNDTPLDSEDNLTCGYEHNPIYIEQNTYLLSENVDGITNAFGNECFMTYALMEFESFEQAYKVALDMREPLPNCYKK